MWAPNAGGGLAAHTLRRILNAKGPETAKALLEIRGSYGDRLRAHVAHCLECAEIKQELYGDHPIPVSRDITACLEQLAGELPGEDILQESS